jgi:peptidoglycan hydrolase-like protein with peptidoglycan-binding domain
MKRTTLVIAGVAILAALAAGSAIGFSGDTPDPEATPPMPAGTAQIKRETLTDAVSVDGDLGFGLPQPIASPATGTVTWLPTVGSTIDRGQTLLRVDDKPVALLFGQLPMYRDLRAGVHGADVAEFEANLRSLGYSGFTVDEDFSAPTTTAVKRWQHELGLAETGVVSTSQVVFARGALRVAQQLVRLGAASPVDVLSVTGTTKVVTMTMPNGDATWAARGATVTVALPDGRSTAGVVDSVTDAQPSQQGTGGGPTVTVIVTIADQKALSRFDHGTFTVQYARRERKNVLTVPVLALVALAEGGYGLELVDGGKSTVVAVRIGMFTDGRVEVSGDGLAEGLMIRVPA